jgi:hypothetical protein
LIVAVLECKIIKSAASGVIQLFGMTSVPWAELKEVYIG